MGFPVPSEYKWNDDASTTVIYNDETELDGLPNPKLVEPVEPSGTKEITITENGTTTEDVAEYANAEITVDVPGGASTLTTKTITENGTYNASSDNADGYSSVTVNVPQPSGTKQISITQNGTTTENVADYASAEITVNVSGGGQSTNYGKSDTQNVLELLYALEHNSLVTGEFTVASYFPANVESEILDTGLVDTVRGIIICDEQMANESGTENLIMNYGYIGSTLNENNEQPIGTGTSFMRRRGDADPKFFGTRMSSVRIYQGKLYATPTYAQNNYTYFQKNHTYRWFAWGYQQS